MSAMSTSTQTKKPTTNRVSMTDAEKKELKKIGRVLNSERLNATVAIKATKEKDATSAFDTVFFEKVGNKWTAINDFSQKGVGSSPKRAYINLLNKYLIPLMKTYSWISIEFDRIGKIRPRLVGSTTTDSESAATSTSASETKPVESKPRQLVLKDSSLSMIWQSTSGTTCAVAPSFYQESGTPIDEDGADMTYVHTVLSVGDSEYTLSPEVVDLCATVERLEHDVALLSKEKIELTQQLLSQATEDPVTLGSVHFQAFKDLQEPFTTLCNDGLSQLPRMNSLETTLNVLRIMRESWTLASHFEKLRLWTTLYANDLRMELKGGEIHVNHWVKVQEERISFEQVLLSAMQNPVEWAKHMMSETSWVIFDNRTLREFLNYVQDKRQLVKE